jgi:hypothetical protein
METVVMPMFAYEGRTATGEVRRGELEAVNQNAVMTKLREMKIKPTTVKKSSFNTSSMAERVTRARKAMPEVPKAKAGKINCWKLDHGSSHTLM